MTDAKQAEEFIENSLNWLEKSVMKKNNIAVQHNRQGFNTLIAEYKNIIGVKNTKNYLKNYTEIIKKGGYLK